MTTRRDPDADAIARLDKVKAPPAPTPPTPLHTIRVPVPRTITAELACPNCAVIVSLEAKLSARLVRDSDGSTTLNLRTRAPKLAHQCDQLGMGLDGATVAGIPSTGERSR